MRGRNTWQAAAAATLLAGTLPAGDWSSWRGPTYRGATEARGLPAAWDEEDVLWSTPLPGPGAATPISVAGRVFLSALDEGTRLLHAMCLDRASGEVLWSRPVGEGRPLAEQGRGRENTLAASSAVSDGEVVCFLFGTGDLVTFDLEGELLWSKSLLEGAERFAINWGYASSPLLHDGRLFVQVLQRDAPSFVQAFDPGTGLELWRVQRPDEARAESQEAYTTPIPFDDGGRTVILVLGADCLTAHAPESGEELWRWCGLNPQDRGNMRQVGCPLPCDEGIVVVTSPQHGAMRGLRVRGGEVEELWTLERPTPDATTPAFLDGRVYAVDGRNQRMVCVAAATGDVLWQGDLGTPSFLRASPSVGDGKVYVVDAEGNVVVVAAGGERFEVLGRVALDSYPTRSTIAIDGDRLLVRTADRILCVGAAKDASGDEATPDGDDH